MDMERLTRQFDAYVTWKKALLREITRYRSWLAHNRLGSDSILAQLDRAQKVLRTDHITLAFVGEFSRGKTELINSLFFSTFGQRMLPSQAGRTTMCTTELFFDPRAPRPYIHLLPIETRSSAASVAQYKRIPRHWVNIPLDPQDPQSMAAAFAQVARTKTMPVEQAIQLGFHPDMLEATGKPGEVWVPAWRHALVNFDHPLLRQGLRILDTPGLNALGSEPELTLSMLPSAQAVIFMLAADAGVTASDLHIWQQHIRQLDDEGSGRLFAVLNKIDVLWDDLAGDAFVATAIAQVQATTARHLGIETEEVLPLSAKQALLAKVRQDPSLLARSQLDRLEALLCERIIAQKEQLLADQVVHQVLTLLNNSQHLLNVRLQKVQEQLTLVGNDRKDSTQVLAELTDRTRRDYGLHHKRLLELKSNQRLLKRQSEVLAAAAPAERMQSHLSKVRANLTGSWTTFGINRAIVQFFEAIEHDLHTLELEAERANKMIGAIYKRHNEQSPLLGADAPTLNLNAYRRELAQLRQRADQFRLHLKTLLTEQRPLTKRFFATLAQEAAALHKRLRREAVRWASEALVPLLQGALEHKQMLETHLLRLKTASQAHQQARQRGEKLRQYQEELEQQLAQADAMLRVLRRPAPIQRQSKVVKLGYTERAVHPV